MKQILLVVAFLYTLPAISQDYSKKDIKAIEKLKGTWKFDNATFNISLEGEKVQFSDRLFHIDIIYFYDDMTFYFYSQSTDDTSEFSHHSGKWLIKDNGKTLVLFDRKIAPPTDEKLLEVQFPIRVRNKKIRIDFTIKLPEESPEENKNNIKAYFKKLE